MTFIEKIESILPEIDIETGIMYCGDDEELFEEVVGEFVEDQRAAACRNLHDRRDGQSHREHDGSG